MKNRLFRIFLLYLLLTIILKFEVYAAYTFSQSSFSQKESQTSSGTCAVTDSVIFNQVMNLENVSVKMTQTDDIYKFVVTANSSYDVTTTLGNKCTTNTRSVLFPMLYKNPNFGEKLRIHESREVPFASFTNGTLYTISYLDIFNVSVLKYYYKYSILTNGNLSVQTDIDENNGDKYFIPVSGRFYNSANSYCFKNIKNYPIEGENNGIGVTLDNNPSKVSYETQFINSESYVKKVTYSINTTLSIKKENIDDYRYVCFGSTHTVHSQYIAGTLNTTIKSYSLCTNTIDLKNYVNCIHNWIVSECSEGDHALKCTLCSWEQKGNHSFEYEYDGTKDSVCVCQKVKKINCHYEINDDNIASETKLHDVNTSNDDIYEIKKTGYKFLGYEKYELQFNTTDLKSLTNKIVPTKKVFIANVATIDEEVGDRSIYYKAIFTPIKYKFIYSSNSNLPKYIKDKLTFIEIEPQVFTYDSKQILKKHIKYDYLVFSGWSLTEGSDKVDFKDEQEVLNYTTLDEDIYTLYPIYETEKYQILYNTLNGKFDNNVQQASELYDFYTDKEMLKPKNMGTNKIFYHYIDIYGNQYNNLSEVREFIKNDIEGNRNVILFAMSKDGQVDSQNGSGENNNSDNEKNAEGDEGGEGGESDKSSESGENGENSGGSEGEESGTSSDSGGNGENTNGDKGSGNDTSSDDIENGNSSGEENKKSDNSSSTDISDDGNGSAGNNADNNNTDNNQNNGSNSNNYNNNNDGNNASGNNTGGSTTSVGGSSKSGSSGSSNSSSGGNGGKNIISNGSIVNGNVVDINVANDPNAPGVYSNEKQILLYNTGVKSISDSSKKKDNNKKSKTALLKNDEKEQKEDEEQFSDLIFGPYMLYEDEDANYTTRGIHGPWYLEDQYVKKILASKKLNDNNKTSIDDDKKMEKVLLVNPLNVKTMLMLSGFILLIIFIIIYEIYNIKSIKKHKKIV